MLKDVQSFVCTRNGCRFYVLILFVQRLLWNRENKQSEKLKFSVLLKTKYGNYFFFSFFSHLIYLFFVSYLYNFDPFSMVKLVFFIFVFQTLTNKQTEINEFAAFWFEA